MSQDLIFESEPFQGYTEFDEFEFFEPEGFESRAQDGGESREWAREFGRGRMIAKQRKQQPQGAFAGARAAGGSSRPVARQSQQTSSRKSSGSTRPQANKFSGAKASGKAESSSRRTPEGASLTETDVRNDRIDADAQRALLRMSGQNDARARADARALNDAVRNGHLTGIYAEDHAVPVRLAARLGVRSSQQLIPGDENAALILESGKKVSEPPTIAFRRKLRSQPLVLDAALRKAWQTFQLLRANKLAPCRAASSSGTQGETSTAGAPVGNLVPSFLCQLRGGPVGSAGGGTSASKSSTGGATPCAITTPTPIALTMPYARICCLLSSMMIDPITYRTRSSFVDISNLGKHGNQRSEALGLIYTGKAGFVDLAHLREMCDVAKLVYDQIVATTAGTPANIRTPHGLATILKCITDPILIARAISYDEGMGHEILSYYNRSPGGHNSSFSPEDLCSNFLGTLVAERAIKAGGNFNDSVDSELYKLLRSLDAQSPAESEAAFNLINGRWVSYSGLISTGSNGYLLRRNFSQKPFQAGHRSDSRPPGEVTKPLPDLSSVYVLTYQEGRGRAIKSTDYEAEIKRIKADAKRQYGKDYDQPK